MHYPPKPPRRNRALLLVGAAVLVVVALAFAIPNWREPATVAITDVQVPPSTTPVSDQTVDAATETISVAPTTTSAPGSAAAPTTTTTTTAPTTTPPKPTTTKPKPPPAPPGADPAEAEVLTIVNSERAKAGCSPLKWNDKLGTAARKHSADMAANNYFDHTSQDGRSPFDRMKAEGYKNAGGENIAAGQATPKAVMDSWMKSPGHRANILNCDFKEIGVGVAKGGSYRIYWTQTFGYA